MHLSFGKDGRLRYDETYGVLICLECQYAVQKSAVESHFLRHKVYRGERRQLLATISQLHLTEPDHVVPPSVPAQPVEGLAVIPGYRCAVADGSCRALCASLKRMRRHCSEAHGVAEAAAASIASDVFLQTFFRGTKLKYFEVAASSPTAPVPRRMSPAQRQPVISSRSGTAGAGAVAGDEFVENVPGSELLPSMPRVTLDMETLQYFHHFVSATSITLPTGVEGNISFWQNEVVSRSLQLRWLMCAVLSIATTHKCSLTRDHDLRLLHAQRADQFRAEFLATWPTEPGVIDGPAIEIGAQIRCIQRLCQITWPSPTCSVKELAKLEWSLLTRTIRGCLDPSVAILTAPFPSDHLVRPANPGTSGRDKLRSMSLAASVPRNAPPTLLRSLRELPFRMAAALSKPSSRDEFVVVVSAIEILTDCFNISYASDDDGGTAAWLGMECWLREVPDAFNDMLSQQVPAALIVLAHWCLLVKRVEGFFWFMQGLEEKVVRGILKQVPDNASIRELVEACRGSLIPP